MEMWFRTILTNSLYAKGASVLVLFNAPLRLGRTVYEMLLANPLPTGLRSLHFLLTKSRRTWKPIDLVC